VSETDLLTRALERGPGRWPHRKHVTTAELTARDLGRNIADQARHVEGVVAVRDRFTYPPPTEAS
jgi:hypothetical protein